MIYRIWILFTVISSLLLYSIVLNVKHRFEKDFPDVDFNELERAPNDELLKSIAQIILSVACPILHIIFAFYLIGDYDNIVENTYKKAYSKLLNKINKLQGMYQVQEDENEDER